MAVIVNTMVSMSLPSQAAMAAHRSPVWQGMASTPVIGTAWPGMAMVPGRRRQVDQTIAMDALLTATSVLSALREMHSARLLAPSPEEVTSRALSVSTRQFGGVPTAALARPAARRRKLADPLA